MQLSVIGHMPTPRNGDRCFVCVFLRARSCGCECARVGACAYVCVHASVHAYVRVLKNYILGHKALATD